jgi:pimeloyl-ACP methyl ester carboxylesterase
MAGAQREVAQSQVTEGTFKGGMPYLKVGAGRPLVYLCGFVPDHVNPTGMGRRITLRTIEPFVRAGYEVYFTNRAPGMAPDTTFADIAANHAAAITDRFGEPVDVIGHSTGGSLVMQLIADHPEVVRRAVAASAAYRLGPVAKKAQLELLHNLEKDGTFKAASMAAGFTQNPVLRKLLSVPMSLTGVLLKIRNPADPVSVLRAEDGYDLYDRLSSIETETLIICGARDYFWTPEMFAETARLMPHGKLVMYPKAGHAIVTKKQFFVDVLTFLSG